MMPPHDAGAPGKNFDSGSVSASFPASTWSITASGSSLHAGDVAALKERIQTVQAQTNSLLPKTALIASPLKALDRYQKNAPTLTYLLFAFSVPILSLILAFIGLVAGLFVGQQRGEMAILRSRGASTAQVVGISLLQGVILGAVALTGGIGLGYWITDSIGKARSFLDFSAAGGLRVSMRSLTAHTSASNRSGLASPSPRQVHISSSSCGNLPACEMRPCS